MRTPSVKSIPAGSSAVLLRTGVATVRIQ